MKKLLLTMIAAIMAIGMNATIVETNTTSGEWTGDKEGYTATINGYRISYLKYNSSNDLIAPSADHIRVYKNAKLVIEAVDGSAITSLEITCTAGNYAYDITVEGGDAVKDGATITWTGNVTRFEGVASNGQVRIKSIKINEGVTEPEVFNPEGTGEGTVESPYDVTRALDIIAHSQNSNKEVYVKGKIAAITEISTSYGNATYNISDDGTNEKVLVVFRGYGLGGEKFEAEDALKVGDEVVVCGKLIDYNGTAEVAQGNSIYSLNGKTYEEPETPAYEPVGDGSREHPYTVADIQGMNIETSDGQKYWVRGFVLGSASSATSLNTADKAVDTNIALGATADAEVFIPVALPAGDMRTQLGVASNPDNVGKEVLVYGTLEKYFSVAGVKNVSDFVLDPTAISTVSATTSNVIYDLSGRQHSTLQRGLNIVDGKKVVF